MDTPSATEARHPREAGQVMVIFALALTLSIVFGVAFVIELGNAFAQQRIAQNGADAAANAGAVVLGERLGGATRTDRDVLSAVTTVAAANGLANPAAVYTDIDGNDLSGSLAVGGGSIPADAAGVHVGGDRDFGTSFARVFGLNQLRASADAAAVAGLLNGVCPAEAGCGVLPVTFPVLISTCEFPHTTTSIGEGPYTLVSIDNRTTANESIVPICTTGPGSVGWLDLGPGNLAQEIVTPSNRAFDLPVWLQTQPGNNNAVEDAINDNYAGTVVLIPMFDGTCKIQPSGTNLSDCPAGQEGTGNNTWYHIPKFTGFFIDEAFIAGNNAPDCSSPPGSPLMGGNGSMSCMKGWFIRFITQGPVVPGSGFDSTSAIGIQLKR